MPKSQLLPGPHSGVKTTITPGDPMSRSMGHYGKGHSFAAPATPTKGGAVPTYPKAATDDTADMGGF